LEEWGEKRKNVARIENRLRPPLENNVRNIKKREKRKGQFPP